MELLCKFWWLLWLLPLLLGLWAWWRKSSQYDKMVAEYDGKIKGLNGRIGGLEDDLSACRSKRNDLEGDLALTKGRMREMESDMKGLKLRADKAEKDAKSGGSKSFSGGNASKGKTVDLGAISSSMTSTPTPEPAKPEPPKAEPPKAEPPKAEPPKAAAKKSLYAGVKSDNLQIIEGIGPKMESVLKENGIDSHKTLGGKSLDELQAILGKYGDKYKIIDPKTWAKQAKLAGDGDFEGLIDLQKKLDAGKDNAANLTDSKLEKYLIKTGALKAFKQDDLKAIEGIGPATDKLLRENGINTWREMANTSADNIKAILTAAGSRFALGDPTTWPKQAELAADGKFDELREYQDFLDGGKA